MIKKVKYKFDQQAKQNKFIIVFMVVSSIFILLYIFHPTNFLGRIYNSISIISNFFTLVLELNKKNLKIKLTRNLYLTNYQPYYITINSHFFLFFLFHHPNSKKYIPSFCTSTSNYQCTSTPANTGHTLFCIEIRNLHPPTPHSS